MTGEHEGVYYPLTGMSKEIQQQLIDDHFLFKVGRDGILMWQLLWSNCPFLKEIAYKLKFEFVR